MITFLKERGILMKGITKIIVRGGFLSMLFGGLSTMTAEET